MGWAVSLNLAKMIGGANSGEVIQTFSRIRRIGESQKGGKLPLALYSRVKSFRLGEGVFISNEVYSKAYYKTLIL